MTGFFSARTCSPTGAEAVASGGRQTEFDAAAQQAITSRVPVCAAIRPTRAGTDRWTWATAAFPHVGVENADDRGAGQSPLSRQTSQEPACDRCALSSWKPASVSPVAAATPSQGTPTRNKPATTSTLPCYSPSIWNPATRRQLQHRQSQDCLVRQLAGKTPHGRSRESRMAGNQYGLNPHWENPLSHPGRRQGNPPRGLPSPVPRSREARA